MTFYEFFENRLAEKCSGFRETKTTKFYMPAGKHNRNCEIAFPKPGSRSFDQDLGNAMREYSETFASPKRYCAEYMLGALVREFDSLEENKK